ncbi:MAG TPA: hypothetical protein VHX88_11905 [Solirubrobacteraceae bacterium]|jgi:hypothetical protein|nr:hypothetical protein [Solirubrobacteraceae bacterium]
MSALTELTAASAAEPPARSPAAARRVRRWATLAIVLFGLACATIAQSFSWNQTSHYDLIRSLAHDHPYIDQYSSNTGDKAFYNGHWYSARAPGLAVYALPWYGLLTAVDYPHFGQDHPAQPGNENNMIWALGLWTAVLPGALMLLLLYRSGDGLEPGHGLAAAISVGIGTMILPFSTLMFSHVFTACLAFWAFAILMRERDGPPNLARVGIAGLIAGYAVFSEYPVAFAAGAIGLFAASRPLSRGDEPGPPWQAALLRLITYGVGLGVGLIPLAAYNKWAFGSFTHVAYADIKRQQAGFFGITTPSVRTAITLLFASRGLLVLAPVLIMGIVGTVMLYRRGRRAEALTIGLIFVLYLIYDSGYYLPYGGGTPGPRFLITSLPFLGLPIAVAFKRFPGPTLGLAVAGGVCYVLATMTHPLIGYETEAFKWMQLLRQGSFQPTVLSMFGAGRGWWAMTPFLVFIAGALVLTVMSTTRLAIDARGLLYGLLAVGGWALFAAVGPHLLGIDHQALLNTEHAGDPTALHKGWGPYPLSGLAPMAFGFAALALVLTFAWPHVRLALRRGRKRTLAPAAA